MVMLAVNVRIGGFDKSLTSVFSVGAAGVEFFGFPSSAKLRAETRAERIKAGRQEFLYFIKEREGLK